MYVSSPVATHAGVVPAQEHVAVEPSTDLLVGPVSFSSSQSSSRCKLESPLVPLLLLGEVSEGPHLPSLPQPASRARTLLLKAIVLHYSRHLREPKPTPQSRVPCVGRRRWASAAWLRCGPRPGTPALVTQARHKAWRWAPSVSQQLGFR